MMTFDISATMATYWPQSEVTPTTCWLFGTGGMKWPCCGQRHSHRMCGEWPSLQNWLVSWHHPASVTLGEWLLLTILLFATPGISFTVIVSSWGQCFI